MTLPIITALKERGYEITHHTHYQLAHTFYPQKDETVHCYSLDLEVESRRPGSNGVQVTVEYQTGIFVAVPFLRIATSNPDVIAAATKEFAETRKLIKSFNALGPRNFRDYKEQPE